MIAPIVTYHVVSGGLRKLREIFGSPPRLYEVQPYIIVNMNHSFRGYIMDPNLDLPNKPEGHPSYTTSVLARSATDARVDLQYGTVINISLH